MGAFSSQGPTREGRLKPDIVAPGTCILSALSRDVANPSTTFGTSSDPLFFFDSGTSMATPLVAGCVAVLRETLIKNGVAAPSAALVKALLINGAVELTGQHSPSEAGPSPNNDSGFGRVDLARSVIIPDHSPGAGFGEGRPCRRGRGNDRGGDPAGPARGPPGPPAVAGVMFKITLVWIDPPGAQLQNDLDLIVRAADGQERHGNVGTAAGFDHQNNVEQVLWAGMRLARPRSWSVPSGSRISRGRTRTPGASAEAAVGRRPCPRAHAACSSHESRAVTTQMLSRTW